MEAHPLGSRGHRLRIHVERCIPAVGESAVSAVGVSVVPRLGSEVTSTTYGVIVCVAVLSSESLFTFGFKPAVPPRPIGYLSSSLAEPIVMSAPLTRSFTISASWRVGRSNTQPVGGSYNATARRRPGIQGVLV